MSESTPLLRPSSDKFCGWKIVIVGAVSLSLLFSFHQLTHKTSVVLILDETPSDEAVFLSDMETMKDPSVDPCVDFYQYACGGWLQTHDIPPDRSSIDSSFSVVSETNKDTIATIFSLNPPQVGPLYHSCLNANVNVDTNATAFVANLIHDVHQVTSTFALMELAGKMDQFLGISTFFSLAVAADPKEPSINVLQLAQGGLTLPSREYYLDESKVAAFGPLYKDYIAKLVAMGEFDKYNQSDYAVAVLEIETALAKISLSNAALRDPWATSMTYPFPEIAARFPYVMMYLNGIWKQEPFPMHHAVIATPGFFEAQNDLLQDNSLLPHLKKYLSFRLIDSFSVLLGESFRRLSHGFHGTLRGSGALVSREEFCSTLTISFLGDQVGKYYMEKVFGPNAKDAAELLVKEIEESMKALLLTESWLDKVTYEAAVEKLNNVKNYIGGPDEIPSLPFELQPDLFFHNVQSLMQLQAAKCFHAIDQPVDKKAWEMFPSTVNAYYDPSANKMVFPAAILQPPFYSAEHFPPAANFARIGMVMGHELSHGFDDQGRNYDSNGALRSWWTPSVSVQFTEKAQCLAAQYSSFPVTSIDDGHVLGHVNGKLTLGENIADNGGIHLAYEAFHLWKSAFTPVVSEPPNEPGQVNHDESSPVSKLPIPDGTVPTDSTLLDNTHGETCKGKTTQEKDIYLRKHHNGGTVRFHIMADMLARAQQDDAIADNRLFFTAFAQTWCEKRTPRFAELLRTIDPHSPGKWRVNGPLMNFNKFAQAFSCPIGSPMNPTKKCSIW